MMNEGFNMKRLVENFINGNLIDATKNAKRFRLQTIYNALRRDYEFSHERAYSTAYYLKYPSQETYQKACDAK